MSTRSSSPVIPPLRTYAGDLDSARSQKPTLKTVVTSLPAVSETTSQTKSNSEAVIPPFHTFSTAAKNNDQAQTQKILTDTSNLSGSNNVKENLPAVIITDTKRKRFKLTQAISTSIKEWWSAKKESAQQKKIPRYTVPEAERRKGVIQKATAKTGRTLSDDHDTVVSRIKATQKATPVTYVEPAAKTAAVVQTPSWETAKTPVKTSEGVIGHTLATSNTRDIQSITKAETGHWETDIQSQVNALGKIAPASAIVLTGKEFTRIKQQRLNDAAVTNNSVDTEAQVIVPNIPPHTITPTLPRKQILPTIPVSPQPETYIKPIVTVATSRPEPEVVPIIPIAFNRPKILPQLPTQIERVFIPEAPTVATVSRTPQTEVAEQFIRPEQPSTPQRRFAPPRKESRSIFSALTQTNPIVFTVFGVLMLLVVSGLFIRAYLFNSSVEPVELTTIPTSSVFTETSVYKDAVIVQTKADIAEALATQIATEDSLTEVNILGISGNRLSGQELFSILNAAVLFDFKSAITDVTLGSYRDAPFIIFTVTDKNTALGGLLNWEKTMYQDLALVFGKTNQFSNTEFSDTIIGTTDVRMIKNSAGEVDLVYGFTDFNSVLITTNETAFLNLTGIIK